MPCWSCAVMSKIFKRLRCQRASDGTDGALIDGCDRTRFGKVRGFAPSLGTESCRFFPTQKQPVFLFG
jgi:hypothetical protein